MDAENPTEKTGWDRIRHAVTTKNIPAAPRDEGNWSRIKRICNPQGTHRPIWRRIFAISCVLAVLVDPFFFYIPFIDQDNKCLGVDKNLRSVALILRSITDLSFLVHLICQICDAVIIQREKNTRRKSAGSRRQKRGFVKEIADKVSWLSVSMIVDFFALLPIPQLLIVVALYKMKVSQSWEYLKVLSVLGAQNLPRVYRVFLSCKDIKVITGISVKNLFNFFLYILVSHVVGAFWYFLSVQREISCWDLACVHHSTDPARCMNGFYCDSPTITSRNITFLNEHCPLDTPDSSALFKYFGIFLDSRKNHNTEQINFGKKFFYSFWWGLRNLSNFGTNLITSTYVGENCFAVLISLTGFILVLYLIGNMQTWQLEAAKAVEIKRMVQKTKKLGVHKWIYANKLPQILRIEIMNGIEQNLRENNEADMQSIFSVLPVQTRKNIKRALCMQPLRKVPILQTMNEGVLEMMCDLMKPVTYNGSSFVFRKGDPLDCMIFIIEGTLWTYSTRTATSLVKATCRPLGKGEFYGEELLNWASPILTELPISTKHVKSHEKMEALALMASDLATVVSKCQTHWDLKCGNSQELKEAMAISTIIKARRHFLHPQRPSAAMPPLAATPLAADTSIDYIYLQ